MAALKFEAASDPRASVLRVRPHIRANEHHVAWKTSQMKLLALSVSAAAVGAFSVQKSSQLTSRRPVVPSNRAPTALSSTRRDPITGKIYVGEPEPLEELADLVGGLLGGLGRVADGLLGPAPVPIPVPVEDEREVPDNGQTPPRDPYKYPGTY